MSVGSFSSLARLSRSDCPSALYAVKRHKIRFCLLRGRSPPLRPASLCSVGNEEAAGFSSSSHPLRRWGDGGNAALRDSLFLPERLMSIYTQRRLCRRWVLKKGFIDSFPFHTLRVGCQKKGISLTVSHSTPCAGKAGAGCGMGRRAFFTPNAASRRWE